MTREELHDLFTEAGFIITTRVAEALVDVVDGIHSHVEEGRRLFPEVVVTSALEAILRPIASARIIVLGDYDVEVSVRRMLKLCSPLARGGWTAFLELQEERARFGVLSVEGTELSPSLRTQLVGQLAPEATPAPFVYIRGVGARRVEVSLPKRSHTFTLGLQRPSDQPDPLEKFAQHFVQRVPVERRTIATSFVLRLLNEAVREAHGCILAVVSDEETAVQTLRHNVADGVYLNPPVDVMGLLRASAEMQNRQASTAVREYSDLIKAMVSHDGITVLSDAGRVIAFNVFVRQSLTNESQIGGARSRAYAALHQSRLVRACLLVSQDGFMRFEENNA